MNRYICVARIAKVNGALQQRWCIWDTVDKKCYCGEINHIGSKFLAQESINAYNKEVKEKELTYKDFEDKVIKILNNKADKKHTWWTDNQYNMIKESLKQALLEI